MRVVPPDRNRGVDPLARGIFSSKFQTGFPSDLDHTGVGDPRVETNLSFTSIDKGKKTLDGKEYKLVLHNNGWRLRVVELFPLVKDPGRHLSSDSLPEEEEPVLVIRTKVHRTGPVRDGVGLGSFIFVLVLESVVDRVPTTFINR